MAANKVVDKAKPVIGINTDPTRSEGHLCLTSGEVFSGEIVGVFDESVFMWTPTEYTTIAVFTCNDASIPFGQFSTKPGDSPAIFSLSNQVIASISLVGAPEG